jgi:hypothetical protein
MLRFIHEENIRRYRKLLEGTTDPEKRQMLLKLLAEEEAKDRPLAHDASADNQL